MADKQTAKAAEPETLSEMTQKTKEEAAKAPPAAEDKAGKVAYILNAPFWDGRVLHRRGATVYFLEGKAPRGSTLVEK